MYYGKITLECKDAIVRAMLSSGKEEVVKTSIIAEDVPYRTWWEDPTSEGMGEIQYDDFEEPTLDEIKPEYEMEFEYTDGRVRSVDDEDCITKITEIIDVIWEGDFDTFIEEREWL